MSKMQSDASMGDQAPLLQDRCSSKDRHPDGQSGPAGENCSQSQGAVHKTELVMALPLSLKEPREVVLSTQSQAALKLGTQQLIPRNLAVASRPRHRHHTTVGIVPVAPPPRADDPPAPAARSEVSWEDYDSDDEGVSIRRNRRNQSYRAALKTPDSRVMPGSKAKTSLAALSEEGGPQPTVTPPAATSRGTGKASLPLAPPMILNYITL